MDPKIIKAEILLTRRCNLHCDYCAMPTNKAELTAKQWIKIFDVLTDELGCPFYPIYGAEPLLHPGIYDIVKYFADSKKSAFSLLTNATMLTPERKQKLLDAGLDSITLSVDSLSMVGSDSIARRNDVALQAIDWALDNHIPDIQGTSTVHRMNIDYIPDLIRFLSAKGVWYSFDFIHDNKGEYAKFSKTSSRTDWAFEDEDVSKIRAFLHQVKAMKKEGYKIYQSVDWFDFLLQSPLSYVVDRDWWCDSNPAWITIDADGQVLICDDYFHGSGVYATDLPSMWDYFCDFKRWAVPKCRGCIWCTHWLSEKQLLDPKGISDVSHGRLKC